MSNFLMIHSPNLIRSGIEIIHLWFFRIVLSLQGFFLKFHTLIKVGSVESIHWCWYVLIAATVRKLGRPPPLIMRIMDCVLILFQRKLQPIVYDAPVNSNKPSWSESLKVGSSFNSTWSRNSNWFPSDEIRIPYGAQRSSAGSSEWFDPTSILNQISSLQESL